MLFTTGKKKEEHSYSAVPILSLLPCCPLMDTSTHCFFQAFWLHMEVKLLSIGTVVLKVPVRSFGYFRDQSYFFLVFLCLACLNRLQIL